MCARLRSGCARRALFGLSTAVLVAACQPGGNADGPYDRDRIEIVVPFREGGGSDTWGRAIAPFLQRHLGHGVRVRVVNVLGASGIQGGNEFALRRKPDGRSLFVSSGSNTLPFLLGERAVRYDFADFTGVMGSPAGGVVYISPSTGVTDITSLCGASRLIYGGISPTGLDMVPLLAFELLGLDVIPILGYQGKGAARLAFEQGETTIDYQTSPAYLANVVPLVDDGVAIPLFSFGAMDDDGTVMRDPVFPDLPSAREAIEICRGEDPSGVEWEAFRAVLAAGFAAQKGLWVHRDAPPERIAALRAAADALIRDQEFLDLTADLLGGYQLYVGETVDRKLEATLAIPPAARAWLIDLLRRKFDVAI